MTKLEFAKRYQEVAQISSLAKASEQIDIVFNLLGETLSEEGLHRLPGFGTWSIRQLPARKGRNPMTGEPIKIKASRAVSFKAALALRERIQKTPRKRKA